jgi:hypothetical protein
MGNHRKYNSILSRGVVAKVARNIGCSHQLAWHRIFVQHDPATLEIAAKIEAETRISKKRALRELIHAKSINIERELEELENYSNCSDDKASN